MYSLHHTPANVPKKSHCSGRYNFYDKNDDAVLQQIHKITTTLTNVALVSKFLYI